jgi:hypothetical protein
VQEHLHALTSPPGIHAQAIWGSKFLPRHCSVFIEFIRNPLLQFSMLAGWVAYTQFVTKPRPNKQDGEDPFEAKELVVTGGLV